MANKQIVCWRVTVVRPGAGGAQVVLPIARDKLQASKRAAYMLGFNWKENARYMVIRGPIKAQARQIREWNETYPQWSTEREDPSSGAARHLPPRGKAYGGEDPSTASRSPSPASRGGFTGGRIATSASPPRNDGTGERTSAACPYGRKRRADNGDG